MNRGVFLKLFFCILCVGFCLYSYIDMQNEITKLRILAPQLADQVRRIEEENTRFSYDIEAFKSPENLMVLAQRSEFAHLKYPTCSEVVTLRHSDLLITPEEKTIRLARKKPTITFATGAKPK